MSISTRLKGFLDENQIPYSILTHATAYTAQGAAATMQISGKELAKTVVLWTGEEMILAVLPAPNHVRLDRLAAEVGKSGRLCSSGEAQGLLIRSERVTQRISRVFLDRLCIDGLEPPFFSRRNKAGTRLRRWGCYLGLLGESGYSPVGVTRSRTHAF